MQIKKVSYPSLNGLRAISILLVLVRHLNQQYFRTSKYYYQVDILADGQMGVNVFFVISGFLITSLLLNEETSSGSVSLKKFYIRRTLRIFPAYYLLLFVYFLLSLLHYIHIDIDSWITAITYTKYFNWQKDFYTAHAWSLSVEEHFYLFWPLIFLAGSKIRKLFVFLIIILVPVIRLVFYRHPTVWVNELTIFFRLDSIALGCVCALYRNEIIEWVKDRWERIFYIAAAIYMVLLCITIYGFKHALNLNIFMVPFAGSYGTITNIIIAMVMMAGVYGAQSTLWYRFFNCGIMNQIGLWSYSIYLWQQLFIHKTDLPVNSLPINLLLLFAAATFSYYIIEKPFMKLKSKFAA